MSTASQSPSNNTSEGPEVPQSSRDRIVHAAGPIFADKGYERTTVREICHAADVNVASINYHFRDKQNLYHETVLFAHNCRSSSFEQPTKLATDPREQLRSKIEQILFSMVVTEDGPWQVRLLLNEIQRPTETCRQLVRDEFRPFVVDLMKTVAAVAGKATTAELQSVLAMSVIGQCMIYRFAPETHAMTMLGDEAGEPINDRPVDLAQLADTVTKFSIAGIQAAVE